MAVRREELTAIEDRLVPLRLCNEAQRFGGKAANLSQAITVAEVPDAVVLDFAGVERGRQVGDVFSVVADMVCDAIDSDFVAVRSSSTAEDTPRLTNAGRFRTEFVRRSPQLIAEASRRVARSMCGTDGGIIYQVVVDARVSGTLVTFVNGSPAPVVVEAAPGLCTTVTSGAAADTFLLDETGGLLREEISFKSAMDTLGEDGPVRVSLSRIRGILPSLTRGDLESLLRLKRTLSADGFDDFLDLEWSLSRTGCLHLLQVRQATT